MGLDMFLYAKRYLSKWNEKDKEVAEKVRLIFPAIKKTGDCDSTEVVFGAGYWRKANAIHAWFVNTVQDKNDDCKEYYVNREQLKELKKLCEQVLKSRYKEKETDLLPTQSGFFFGGTEYEDEYYDDLKRTIKIVDYCLSLPDEFDFYYSSSW